MKGNLPLGSLPLSTQYLCLLDHAQTSVVSVRKAHPEISSVVG